jgi:hypothetical protein
MNDLRGVAELSDMFWMISIANHYCGGYIGEQTI